MTVSLVAGWNLIAGPYLGVPYTAETMAQSMQAQGGTPREIVRWWAGGWSSYVVGIPANRFAVETNRGYFVRCATPGAWIP